MEAQGESIIKTLIAADDFTGALDTGIQFQLRGIPTVVTLPEGCSLEEAFRTVQVVVVDTETRKVPADEAYHTIFQLTQAAVAAGAELLYKKTDSTLRGNVAAEVRAMLDASGMDTLRFVPAHPLSGRTTENGIQRVDGVPLHLTAFGKDPYEPVVTADVREILRMYPGDAPVSLYRAGAKQAGAGIQVCDAATLEDVADVCRTALRQGVRCLAGCAGLASQLAELGDHRRAEPGAARKTAGMFVFCGSVNPISGAQLSAAEKCGALRFRVPPELSLDPNWPDQAEGAVLLRRISSAATAQKLILIDTQDVCPGDCARAAEAMGLCKSEMRGRISSFLGMLAKKLLRKFPERTFFMTGGDTLMGFMECIACGTLQLVCELESGVVVSELPLDGGRSLQVVTKAGGLGGEQAVVRAARALIAEEPRESRHKKQSGKEI